MESQHGSVAVPRGATPEDDQWTLVLAALQDVAWDFRTVQGIANDAQLPSETVERLLREHRSDLRKRRGRDGRTIYRLRSKPASAREILADVQVFASKSL